MWMIPGRTRATTSRAALRSREMLVEPVKFTIRTRGSATRAATMSAASARSLVTTLRTSAGSPASVRVVLDLLGQFAGALPGNADGLVGEGAVLGEGRGPGRHVHLLGDLVRLTDELLVVRSHVTSP